MQNYPSKDDIVLMISSALTETFGIDQAIITSESRLKELGVDSLHVVDIMLDIEDNLGIKLTDLSFPPNPSIAEVADTIERNLSKAKQG